MSASRTYKARGIVLRKTKLGEKDLIVTLLSEDGSLLRAVAKGARKPGGSLAARIDLFRVVDALLAKGRNLDVIAEAKLAADDDAVPFGLEQSACASVVAEIVCTVAQEGLEHPRLFAMTSTALPEIARSDARTALGVMTADLLKTLASEGFTPSFDTCVVCGKPVNAGNAGGSVAVSLEDGGVVCPLCQRPSDAVLVDAAVLAWAKVLLYTRFADVGDLEIDERTTFGVLHFARQWARVHAGKDLKSLDFVFTGGLF